MVLPGSSAPAAVPATLDRHTRGLLRYVKINERSLTQTIQRLGGGERGLRVLLYHITVWAKAQRNGAGATDANFIVKGLEYLSKLNDNARDMEENRAVPAHHVINYPAPRSNNSNANTSEHPYHPITDETAYQAAVYTRALRKARLARQRRQHTNHPRLAALEDRWQPWRACWRSRTRSAPAMGNGRLQRGLDPDLAAGDRQDCAFLFHKELRASDVNSFGRVVLPKKDAELHFPGLTLSGGMLMTLEDYHAGKYWVVRYRFWLNNKSRMYVLENIGDFVACHKLQEGDFLVCYRKSGGTYVIRALKLPTHEVLVSKKQPCSVNTLVQARDETKDFLGRDEARHMNQGERTRIALMAQQSPRCRDANSCQLNLSLTCHNRACRCGAIAGATHDSSLCGPSSNTRLMQTPICLSGSTRQEDHNGHDISSSKAYGHSKLCGQGGDISCKSVPRTVMFL